MADLDHLLLSGRQSRYQHTLPRFSPATPPTQQPPRATYQIIYPNDREKNRTIWDGTEFAPGGSMFIQTLDELYGRTTKKKRVNKNPKYEECWSRFVSVFLIIVLIGLIYFRMTYGKAQMKAFQEAKLNKSRQLENDKVKLQQILNKQMLITFDWIRIGGPLKLTELEASLASKPQENLYDKLLERIRKSKLFMISGGELKLSDDWWVYDQY